MCLTETCQISKLHVERQGFSSCVWLGQQRRPLNILLSVLHCPDSTAPHTDTWRGWVGGQGVWSSCGYCRVELRQIWWVIGGFCAQGCILCYTIRIRTPGRRRGVCNQMLSPVMQRSIVQVSSCQSVPLESLGPGFHRFLEKPWVVSYYFLFLFTCCFMAVHTAQ